MEIEFPSNHAWAGVLSSLKGLTSVGLVIGEKMCGRSRGCGHGSASDMMVTVINFEGLKVLSIATTQVLQISSATYLVPRFSSPNFMSDWF